MAKNQSANTFTKVPDLLKQDGSYDTNGFSKGKSLLAHFFQENKISDAAKNSFQNASTGENLVQGRYNCPFSTEELNLAIATLNHSAPGPDSIHNIMLKNLTPEKKEELLSLYNNSWNTGFIPSTWKTAKIVPILKPGKNPNMASSYRPIALSNTMLKLLERMVLSRLIWILEKETLFQIIKLALEEESQLLIIS